MCVIWVTRIQKCLDSSVITSGVCVCVQHIFHDEVKTISKLKFKKIIEMKVDIHVRKELQKMKKSKTNHLIIGDKPKTAKYLTSKNLTVKEVQTLFRLRSRTVNIKDNQKSTYKDNPWCRTCSLFNETQEHVFQCSEIRTKVKHLNLNFNSVSYQMIYGNLEKQEKFVKIYQVLLETRSDILQNSLSPEVEDPSTGENTEMQLTSY